MEMWLGAAFAWCAAPRLRADGVWSHPAALLPVLYGIIVLAPSTAYLYLAYPDWSWLYLVDAGRVPRLAVIPAVSASVAAVVAGWAIGGRVLVVRGGRGRPHGARRRLAAGLGVGAAAVALMALLLRHRLVHAGSLADYQAGRAVPLFDTKLGFVLVALIIGALAAAGFVAAELRRDARRAGTGNLPR
jgi:hypothetical protein